MKIPLLTICVIRLIVRCKLLLLQRSTLCLCMLLHANACSSTRTYRSFRPRTTALLLEASLSPRPTLLLYPTSRVPDLKLDMRSHKRTPTRRHTRSPTLLHLDCTGFPILTLQRRSSCRKVVASFVNRLGIVLLSALTRKLEFMKSLPLLKNMKIWEKNSL